MENHLETVQKVLEQVNRVILGKEEEIREVMLAFLAKGHVLLEDNSGSGKDYAGRSLFPDHAPGL